MRKCTCAALLALIAVANAAMPVCSLQKCPTQCSCVESKCGKFVDSCTADSQCNTLLYCMLGCSCGDIMCAADCHLGKTLNSVSESVKTCASSCASTSERVTLYDRKVVPPTWHFVSRALPHQQMHFLVAVKQQNLKELEAKFWDVSDPKSKSWQQFMTKEDIGKLIAAKPEDMGTVKKWLKASLATDAVVTTSVDGVEVRCSTNDVERLFDTEIFSYTHDNGHALLRTMGAHSVPKYISDVIDFVEGIADFPMHRTSARRHVEKPKEITSTTALTAPQTLLKMYGVPAAKVSKVSVGPVEFHHDTSYNKQDLVTFFKQLDLPDQTVSDIVGPYNGEIPDEEATLDVQYITSIGEKQVNWYWTADNWMYQWSHDFFNAASIPDEVSISWGWAEDQQCASFISSATCSCLGIDPATYVARVNTEFQKIGLRGVSIFVSSGDSGANGRTDNKCTDKVLHASFPASSPYVTAVGATMLTNPKFDLESPPPACSAMGAGFACASGGTEVAVSLTAARFTSGGGFSTYTAMPAYQKMAVEHYLTEEASKLPPSTYFNQSKRAYPDVASMGNNFLIYMSSNGGWTTTGGTSASTPTFAGVSAYLNDYSYNKTGKPLGFLNPLLYQMFAEEPTAFTDVTVGDNKCTEAGCFSTCKGYEAATGWDPVTGMGTPNTAKMLAYIEKQFAMRDATIVV